MMMARCCRCPTSVPVGVFDNRHAPYKNYAYLRNDPFICSLMVSLVSILYVALEEVS